MAFRRTAFSIKCQYLKLKNEHFIKKAVHRKVVSLKAPLPHIGLIVELMMGISCLISLCRGHEGVGLQIFICGSSAKHMFIIKILITVSEVIVLGQINKQSSSHAYNFIQNTNLYVTFVDPSLFVYVATFSSALHSSTLLRNRNEYRLLLLV